MSDTKRDSLDHILHHRGEGDVTNHDTPSPPSSATLESPNAPGALRGEINVTVHTREAYSLLTGLDARNKQAAPNINYLRSSLFAFEKLCQSIELGVRHDDPYADYYFYTVHQRLIESQSKLNEETVRLSTWFKEKLPESLTYSSSRSTTPTVVPIRARTKLFFLALYLLAEVDKYITQIYLGCHFALYPKRIQNNLIYEKMNIVRSITEFTQKYRHTEAARDDFAANNARARAAIEKHGFELQAEFLEGNLRSDLAPDILRRPTQDAPSTAIVDEAIKQVQDDPLTMIATPHDQANNDGQSSDDNAPREAHSAVS